MVTSESHTPRRRRRAGTIFAAALGGLLLLAIAGTAWVGVRGFLAYQHLSSAQETAADATTALSDPSKASALIDDLAQDTSAAHDLTSDVVWKLAEGLPWVGPQLAALSTIAAAIDDVASHSLAPLASVAESFSLDSIRPQGGAIALAPFTDIEEAATAGAQGLGVAHQAVDAIDPAPLLGPVRTAVAQVVELLDQAHNAADALQRTARLLPPMLGADAPRDYVVVFQNNAEWRSLGGIAGAMMLLHTDNGQISLAAQASTSTEFSRYEQPIIPLTDDELRLFGAQSATYPQNFTQIPDFTRGAPILQAFWKQQRGIDIAGVISLDPVALSYLLAATGPVRLASGEQLTSDNAVSLLLNEVYFRYEEPADQDAFFASAAAAVFDKITTGEFDAADFVTALGRAGAEDRLLVWNAAADEQAVLDGTTLQGVFTATDPDVTDFGVFVNDSGGSKMDYYMDFTTDSALCGADEAALTVTLRNNAPADAASLPEYLTADGYFGVAAGDVETVTYVYLPENATVLSTSTRGNGTSPGFGGGTDAGRQVIAWSTLLSPGEELTLDVVVRTASTNAIVTRMTPTINRDDTPAVAVACASPE